MPRKARVTSATGVYHVMLRGINRNVIFHDEQDFRKFIKVLENQAHPVIDGIEGEPSCNIYAYCLMSNHVHLLIQELSKPLSELMKKLLRYIHQNPVKAGMVNALDAYPWSSWFEYKYDKPGLCVQSLPFVGITWDEIKEMVCAINENDEAHDIGIENTLKMTDDQVRAYLSQICEQEGLNPNLKELPREKRNYVLFKAFEAGIGVRQLSRITFIAHSTIHRLSLLAKER